MQNAEFRIREIQESVVQFLRLRLFALESFDGWAGIPQGPPGSIIRCRRTPRGCQRQDLPGAPARSNPVKLGQTIF